MTEKTVLRTSGFVIHKGFFGEGECALLVEDLRAIARQAPMRSPVMRGGKAMSVKMTSAGRLGWISDQRGYRYEPRQPNGGAWPAIPARVLDIWQAVTALDVMPDCCLVNYYGEGARMGLHQDRDEGDFSYPVVSVSLGDAGLFRMGGVDRSDPTRSVWLESGDVVVMEGKARLAFHGVDRIRFGSCALLPDGGRLNITLRVVADQGRSEQHPP